MTKLKVRKWVHPYLLLSLRSSWNSLKPKLSTLGIKSRSDVSDLSMIILSLSNTTWLCWMPFSPISTMFFLIFNSTWKLKLINPLPLCPHYQATWWFLNASSLLKEYPHKLVSPCPFPPPPIPKNSCSQNSYLLNLQNIYSSIPSLKKIPPFSKILEPMTIYHLKSIISFMLSLIPSPSLFSPLRPKAKSLFPILGRH